MTTVREFPFPPTARRRERPAETQYLLQAVRNAPSWNGVDNDKVRSLAKREMEVAELASQGQSNRQIAEQLKLREHTVKNCLFRVFEKLGVSNRVEVLFLLYNARDDGAGRQGWATPAARSRSISKPPKKARRQLSSWWDLPICRAQVSTRTWILPTVGCAWRSRVRVFYSAAKAPLSS